MPPPRGRLPSRPTRGLSDEERARLYAIARLTPAQADRWFASVSHAEARRRLDELKAQPMLWDHERVEACALARRLGEALEVWRLDFRTEQWTQVEEVST